MKGRREEGEGKKVKAGERIIDHIEQCVSFCGRISVCLAYTRTPIRKYTHTNTTARERGGEGESTAKRTSKRFAENAYLAMSESCGLPAPQS